MGCASWELSPAWLLRWISSSSLLLESAKMSTTSVPQMLLSQKVSFWGHGVGIHPEKYKEGWREVVRQRGWVVCLATLGWALGTHYFGACWAVTTHLVTYCNPHMCSLKWKKAKPIRGFSFSKTSKKIIQLQLEDTWMLSLNQNSDDFAPCSPPSPPRNFFFF